MTKARVVKIGYYMSWLLVITITSIGISLDSGNITAIGLMSAILIPLSAHFSEMANNK